MAIAGFYYRQSNTAEPVSNDPMAQIVSNDNVADVVKRYSDEYDANTKEFEESDYTQWDRARLDKAYFNLVYADKVGAFSQVHTMLSMIEAAQRNGLDIDDNSYGVDQDEREAIRSRANAAQAKIGGGDE